jgi:hypothetical protein
MEVLKDVQWVPVPYLTWAMLGIRDILVRIRIRGFIPLINESGSGSCYFRQKLYFLLRFLFITFFEATFQTFFFKDKKS